MLIDDIAASLPTENVTDYTRSRIRSLRSGSYVRGTKFRDPKSGQIVIKTVSRPRKTRFKRFPEYWTDTLPFRMESALKRADMPRNHTADAQSLIRDVGRKHGISIEDIVSSRGTRPVAIARQECCYVLKTCTTMSLKEIGRFLGGRDHTTVLHGIRRHAERMERGEV